jgi:hypothetical protein
MKADLDHLLTDFLDEFVNKIFEFLEHIKNNDFKYERLFERKMDGFLKADKALQLRKLQSENINIKDLYDKITTFENDFRTVENIWKSIKGIYNIFQVFNDFKNIFQNEINSINTRIHDDIDKIKESADKIKLEYIIKRITDKINLIDKFSKLKFDLVDQTMIDVKNTLISFSFNKIIEYLRGRFDYVKQEFMKKLIQFIKFDPINVGVQTPVSEKRYSYFMFLGPVPITWNFGVGFGYGWSFSFGISGFDIYSTLNLNSNSYVQASVGIGLPLMNFSAYIRGIFAQGDMNMRMAIPLLNAKFNYSICFNARFGTIEAGVYFEIRIDLWLVKIHIRINMYGPVTLYGGYQTNEYCPVKVYLG